jgi:predicted DCC family thiol-disulfide oxidoreductase YuxK
MSASLALLYDGGCHFCIRSLRLLKRFDPNDRLELVDATDRDSIAHRFPQAAGSDLDAAMYAVDQHRVYRGFDAFRRALHETPALAWLLPFLYVPGIPQLGRLVYGMIARNRHSLGCTSEICKP